MPATLPEGVTLDPRPVDTGQIKGLPPGVTLDPIGSRTKEPSTTISPPASTVTEIPSSEDMFLTPNKFSGVLPKNKEFTAEQRKSAVAMYFHEISGVSYIFAKDNINDVSTKLGYSGNYEADYPNIEGHFKTKKDIRQRQDVAKIPGYFPQNIYALSQQDAPGDVEDVVRTLAGGTVEQGLRAAEGVLAQGGILGTHILNTGLEQQEIKKAVSIKDRMKALNKGISNIGFIEDPESAINWSRMTSEEQEEFVSLNNELGGILDEKRQTIGELASESLLMEASTNVGAARKAFNEWNEIDPDFRASAVGQFTHSLGQLGFFIPASMVPVLGPLAIESSLYQEAVDDYRASGGTDPLEELSLGLKFALPAVILERAGLETIIGRVWKTAKSTRKMRLEDIIKRAVTEAPKGAIVEGVTEPMQGMLLDYIASKEYDENRGVLLDPEAFKRRLVEFALGASVGGVARGGTEITRGMVNTAIPSNQEWGLIKERESATQIALRGGQTAIDASNGDTEAQQQFIDNLTPEESQDGAIDKTEFDKLLSDLNNPEMGTTDAVNDLAEKISPEAKTPSNETLAQLIETTGTKIDDALAAPSSLSTQIGRISPIARNRVRRMDQKENLYINNSFSVLQTFIDSVDTYYKSHKDNQKLIDNLDIAVHNMDVEYLESQGITGVNQLRNWLEQAKEEIPQIEGFIGEYFPRNFDYDQFIKDKARNPTGIYKDAIQKKEKKLDRKLTEKEKKDLVGGVLNTRRGLSAQGRPFTRKRSVTKVNDKILQYYDKPLVSLDRYVISSSKLRARNEFLGMDTNTKNADPENISSTLYSTIEEDDIKDVIVSIIEADPDKVIGGKSEEKLNKLIRTRLNYVPSGPKIQAYRTAVALKYVSGPKTILMQFADLGRTAYATGLGESLKSIKDKEAFVDQFGAEVDLTIQEVGIDALDVEIREAREAGANSLIQEAVTLVFTPLRKTDVINKAMMLKAFARTWRRKARGSNRSGLEAELTTYFGDAKFATGVVEDLSNGMLSEDVKFALFSKIADFHPISISEHVPFYLEHEFARPFFTLKSFAFKNYDVIYRDSFGQMLQGFTQASAAKLRGDVEGAKEAGRKFALGATATVMILIKMYIVETLFEVMWDELMKNTTEKDRPDQTFLNAYLENLASIFPGFNPVGFRIELERSGLWEAFKRGFSLPEPIGLSTAEEALDYITKGEEWSPMQNLRDEIPVLKNIIEKDD